MADINASLHITKRKRKSNVQHHSQADDLRARFKVPEWGVFCHTERLRDHPARLKLDLSDSTMAAFGWSEKAVDPSEQLSLRRLAFR